MTTERTQSNLPINFQEQLAKEASEIAKRIATPSGDRIRYKGNQYFCTPDDVEDKVLEVVIIDFVTSNVFYEGVYDPKNIQSPACFAIGLEPSTLVPSANSPLKQADSCAACPNNQFGSAMVGKGKACKNTRLVAVMPASALDTPDEDAPIWIMSIPPTSLRAFDVYAMSLAAKHRTVPIGVITEITLDQSTQYASPRFNVVRPLSGDEIGLFIERRQEAKTRLLAEPDVSGFTPAKPAGRAGARPISRK